MNLKTRIRSTAMRFFSSERYLESTRDKARKRNKKNSLAPTVHYFHEPEDPYSQLAVQTLNDLKSRYTLPFEVHLTTPSESVYRGSHKHFDQWALQDVLTIAADYGLAFAAEATVPALEDVLLVRRKTAAALKSDNFAQAATEIGAAFWAGTLSDSDSNRGSAGDSATSSALPPEFQNGDAKRAKLGHYQGAMFYFEGEWFWGVDRIRLLEKRLQAEGYDSSGGPLCVPEPTPEKCKNASNPHVVLEYFPSLRSPYTAIGHARVLELVAQTGVTLKVRPVMPMLMRGIPAPQKKQRYIITDAGREGRECGSPLGKVVDPFGPPVRKAFALFPGADSQGKGLDFVTAYLQAAWFDGVDITNDKGLRVVAANAGLDWERLKSDSATHDWEAVLEDNLTALMQENLWGVPSFRVSGGTQSGAYACWGQDRIWRIANEIARRS